MNNSNDNEKGCFVFFGPANVGKSTIIGYLMTHYLSSNCLSIEIDKIKEKIGDCYQKRRLYSYFVDEAKDEYQKNLDAQFGTTHGTSKYVHIKKIGNFVLIDTPGGNEYEVQRHKGLSLANIGIFAIEIQQLLDLQEKLEQGNTKDYLKNVRDFFCSWYVWNKLHSTSNTIVLLTKYDLSASKHDYENAKNILHSIIGEDINEIVVIPTSIDIENRSDINIFTKLSCDWYEGKTLMEAIKEKGKYSQDNEIPQELLMFYNRKYENVRGVGSIIKWKINSGSISIRDKLVIAPVLINKKFAKIIASIKSMRDEENNIEYGNAGDIVNIAISNINYENSTISKDKVEIPNTAIISSADKSIRMGNVIKVSIALKNCKKEDADIIKSISHNEQVRILWFGKVLFPTIASLVNVNENEILLDLKLNNKQVALPDSFIPRKILLQLVSRNEVELPINFDCIVLNICNSEE